MQLEECNGNGPAGSACDAHPMALTDDSRLLLRQNFLNNPNKHMSQWKADCLFSSSPSLSVLLMIPFIHSLC